MKIVKTNLILKFKSNSGILREIHCCIELKTKYNLITGNSGIGKTVLESAIRKLRVMGEKTVTDYNNNIWYYCTDLDNLFDNSINNADIILYSDQVSSIISSVMYDKQSRFHNELKNFFKRSTAKHIFIHRDMRVFTIDYKSIFKLQRMNDINIVVRLFDDYTTFRRSSHYITEDSTSGLTYYKHHFNNVDTSNGKDNLNALAKSGDTVIADGSAIGYVPELLLRKDINLYLPESFEYDLAKAWQPNEKTVANYFEDMPDSTDSVEQYFEQVVLPDLCIKNHLPKYKKEKNLHPVLLNTIIHKQDIDHHGITQTIAKRHNINFDDEEACKALAEKLSH